MDYFKKILIPLLWEIYKVVKKLIFLFFHKKFLKVFYKLMSLEHLFNFSLILMQFWGLCLINEDLNP